MEVNLGRLMPAIIVGSSLALYSILSSNTIMSDCAFEYEQSCKMHAIGSAEADQCLRNLGTSASMQCQKALVVNEPMKIVGDEVPPQDPGTLLNSVENMQTAEPVPLPSLTEEVPVEEVIREEKITTEPIPNFPPKPEKEDSSFERLGKEIDKAKNAVTRTVKKASAAVKKTVEKTKKAYAKHTKSNIEYAKRPVIVKQNKIRREWVNNGFIMPEGINAEFGRR